MKGAEEGWMSVGEVAKAAGVKVGWIYAAMHSPRGREMIPVRRESGRMELRKEDYLAYAREKDAGRSLTPAEPPAPPPKTVAAKPVEEPASAKRICSFCGKTQDNVDKLVVHESVGICNECAWTTVGIIAANTKGDSRAFPECRTIAVKFSVEEWESVRKMLALIPEGNLTEMMRVWLAAEAARRVDKAVSAMSL